MAGRRRALSVAMRIMAALLAGVALSAAAMDSGAAFATDGSVRRMLRQVSATSYAQASRRGAESGTQLVAPGVSALGAASATRFGATAASNVRAPGAAAQAAAIAPRGGLLGSLYKQSQLGRMAAASSAGASAASVPGISMFPAGSALRGPAVPTSGAAPLVVQPIITQPVPVLASNGPMNTAMAFPVSFPTGH